MPIRHVYEKVKEKRVLIRHSYEITLEDGTYINLPRSAGRDFQITKVGDRVLIDFEFDQMPSAAQVSIFRDQQLVTHFFVNQDFVEVAESA